MFSHVLNLDGGGGDCHCLRLHSRINEEKRVIVTAERERQIRARLPLIKSGSGDIHGYIVQEGL